MTVTMTIIGVVFVVVVVSPEDCLWAELSRGRGGRQLQQQSTMTTATAKLAMTITATVTAMARFSSSSRPLSSGHPLQYIGFKLVPASPANVVFSRETDFQGILYL